MIPHEILQHFFGVFFADSKLPSVIEILGDDATLLLDDDGGMALLALLLVDIILIASVGLVLRLLLGRSSLASVLISTPTPRFLGLWRMLILDLMDKCDLFSDKIIFATSRNISETLDPVFEDVSFHL